MDSLSNIVKTKDTKPTPPELNEQRAGKPKTKPKSPSKTKTSPSKHSPVKTSITGASAGGGSYKPSHPEITMRLLEIALNGLTVEQRVQVAIAHGIVPNLLHMSWANVQKKKILKIVRDGL